MRAQDGPRGGAVLKFGRALVCGYFYALTTIWLHTCVKAKGHSCTEVIQVKAALVCIASAVGTLETDTWALEFLFYN